MFFFSFLLFSFSREGDKGSSILSKFRSERRQGALFLSRSIDRRMALFRMRFKNDEAREDVFISQIPHTERAEHTVATTLFQYTRSAYSIHIPGSHSAPFPYFSFPPIYCRLPPPFPQECVFSSHIDTSAGASPKWTVTGACSQLKGHA